MSNARRLFAASCFALLLLLAGCGSSPPVRYFSLEPIDAATSPGADEFQFPVVGLGPVEMPGYLSRPQIVRRGHDAEIIVDDFRRWAEPLDRAVNRIVAANVEALVGGVSVVAAPYNSLVQPGYRVHASVDRFDADGSGRAVLVVQWGIVANDRETVVAPRRVRYEALASDAGDVASVVKALNDTVVQFSTDVADRLKVVLELRSQG